MGSTASDLLTTAQVADYLGVSRAHIYRLMSTGQLPYIAISREVRRVRRSALDDWLDRRTRVGAVPADVARAAWAASGAPPTAPCRARLPYE